VKCEELVFEGGKPGMKNICEAVIVIYSVYQLLKKYPLEEITVIAPYKRQIRLIREKLSREKAEIAYGKKISEKRWENFIYSRIATVDSFQGGESDAVVISYVRSNFAGGIGFVDNANRINVAHTRCRRDMVVIGDIECLKRQARNEVFRRLERTIARDGEFLSIDQNFYTKISEVVLEDADICQTVTKKSSEKIVKLEIDIDTTTVIDETISNTSNEFPELVGMEQPDLF
jgi:hypothetical protein